MSDKITTFAHEAIEAEVEYHRAKLWHQVNEAQQKCESPIERLMAIALALMPTYVFGGPYPVFTHGEHDLNSRAAPDDDLIRIYPQAQIGKYRADFVIEASAPGATEKIFVVVECDGHDFHERTKEQAARDRKRDRWMMAQGYKVFRFTGSEIFKNPQICAREIINFLTDEGCKLIPYDDGDAV